MLLVTSHLSLSSVHLFSQFLNILVVHILIKGHIAVYDTTRGKFDDTIGDSLRKFMVVGGEKHGAFEVFQRVVEGGDTLQIQVVGRFVEH